MGDIRVGDTVLGADGHPTTVTNATDVMTGRPCFKVIFDDGTEIIADAEHQWLTETRASRRACSSALAGSGGGVCGRLWARRCAPPLRFVRRFAARRLTVEPTTLLPMPARSSCPKLTCWLPLHPGNLVG